MPSWCYNPDSETDKYQVVMLYVIKSVWLKKMNCITADEYKDATQIHNHVTS